MGDASGVVGFEMRHLDWTSQCSYILQVVVAYCLAVVSCTAFLAYSRRDLKHKVSPLAMYTGFLHCFFSLLSWRAVKGRR